MKKIVFVFISILIFITSVLPNTVFADDTLKSSDISISFDNKVILGRTFSSNTTTASVSYTDDVKSEWIKTDSVTVYFNFEPNTIIIPDVEYVSTIYLPLNVSNDELSIRESDSITVNDESWTVKSIDFESENEVVIEIINSFMADGDDLFEVQMPDFDNIYYRENNWSSIERAVIITPKYDMIKVSSDTSMTNVSASVTDLLKPITSFTKGEPEYLYIIISNPNLDKEFSFEGTWSIGTGNKQYDVLSIDINSRLKGPLIQFYNESGEEWISSAFIGAELEKSNTESYTITKRIKNMGSLPAMNFTLKVDENFSHLVTINGADSITLDPGEETTIEVIFTPVETNDFPYINMTISYDVEVSADKTINEVINDYVYLYVYSKIPVLISLTEYLDGPQLEGATIRVESEWGEFSEEFTTTSKEKEVLLKTGENFYIKQLTNPAGYTRRNTTYSCYLENDGTISMYVNSPSESSHESRINIGDNYIRLFNDKISDTYDINFITTDNRFSYYSFDYLSGIEVSLVDYETKEVIDSWVSDDKKHVVTMTPGIYEITGKSTLNNYDRTYRIQLNEDGRISFIKQENPPFIENIKYLEYDEFIVNTSSDRYYSNEPFARTKNSYFYLHIVPPVTTDSADEVDVILIDGNTEKPIEGVSIKYYENRNDNLIEEWISGSEPHRIVDPDERWIRSIRFDLPDGYYGNTYYETLFDSEFVGGKYSLIMRLYKINENRIRVNISSRGINKELPGAVFELYDYQHNLIDRWESTNKPHTVYLLPNINQEKSYDESYDYYIKEVLIPDNCYPIYNSYPFALDYYGKLYGEYLRDPNTNEVYGIGKNYESTRTFSNNIIIPHRFIYHELQLQKKDALTNNMIDGGLFEVRYGTTPQGSLYGEYEGSIEGITIRVPVASAFTIYEKKAPNNYDGAAKLSMHFDSTGNLAALENDGYWKYYESNDAIVLYNNRVSQDIYLNKVDEIGNNVPGAELCVYSEDGALIHKIISSEERIKITLPIGKYVLKETRTPNGYYASGELKFEITEDGKLVSSDNNELITIDDLTITVVNPKKPDEPKRENKIPKTGIR